MWITSISLFELIIPGCLLLWGDKQRSHKSGLLGIDEYSL